MSRFNFDTLESRQLNSAVPFGTSAPTLDSILSAPGIAPTYLEMPAGGLPAATVQLGSAPTEESAPVVGGSSSTSLTDLSSTLKTVAQQNNVPGMVAMEFKNGKETAEGATGVRKRGTTAALNVTDRMHVGSILKSMTATMVGRLVDKKLISFDLTIGQMLGTKLSAKVRAQYLNITLGQLLGHRSGLPSDAGLTPDFFLAVGMATGTPMQARSSIMVAAMRIKPTGTPGSTFLYSNIGYVVAAGLVERVTGKSYEQLMQDEVFTPLGMTSPVFGPPLKTLTSGASGHTATGTPTDPKAEDAYNTTGAFTPAGDMAMTIADVAKYANVHAGATTGYLSAATLTRLHTPLPGPGEKYALGMFSIDAPYVGTLLDHDGTNQYWYARMLINPKTKSVMVIATNQGGPNGAAAVSAAMNKLMGGFLGLPFTLPTNISLPSVG